MTILQIGNLIALLGIGIAVGGSGSIFLTKNDRLLVNAYREAKENGTQATVEQKLAYSNFIAYISGAVLFLLGTLLSIIGISL